MLEKALLELKGKLVEYASHVEMMIEKSIKGLLDKDEKILKEVIFPDEEKSNKFELEIDDMCINIIAQFEPKAKPLRTVLMIMKMNNDLERMADHAVNISQSALFLIKQPPVKPLIDIPRMAEEAKGMLSDSIKSFIKEDVALAKSVCERDDKVDAYREQIIRELITYMVSNPDTIERSLHLIRISGNLERIADLSTNICEDVIFMVEGKVIKHHAEELFQKQE